MANSDPASLDNLHKFVVPDPVGWFPLAPVWKIAIALAMVWIATWVWLRFVQFLREAYRREAIREMHGIEAAGDVVRLNELLKRTAMTAYGRDTVASLSGQRWIAFLASATDRTFETSIAILSDVSSQAKPVVLSDKQREEIFSFARDWIRHHKSSVTPC